MDEEKVEKWQIIFSYARKSLWMVTIAMKFRHLLLGRKAMTNLDIKKQRHHFADKGPYSSSYGFSSIHVQMGELYHKEGLVPNNCFYFLNCGAGEDSWEYLRAQGHQTSQPWRKSTLNIHWKYWCLSWSSDILATWWEEPTHWKRPWCCEKLKAGGKGDDRGWDGWMASSIQWTCLSKLRELVMARETWRAVVHGVAKSRTRLSDRTELNLYNHHFRA